MPGLLDYFRPQPTPFEPFNSRVTYYAPGPGDRMEGGFKTSQPNPATGRRVPSTLDDVRLGISPFVTLASDPSRYGQTIKMGPQTYTSPIDRQTYTLPDVTGYVHDTGSAFQGRPDKLDVATGDFRGWSPQDASALVTADAGNRTVTPLSGDEADRAMRPIGLPEPWRATGEGENPPDAYASASVPARKSMADSSLMDMFQPRSNVDNTPIGYGDAIAQNRNSLIGLGLGLLQPRSLAVGAPVGSAYTSALQGYQQGAQSDATNAFRQQALAHQKLQDARQAAMDKFNMGMRQQEFARGGETPFQKMTADIAKYGPAAEKFYATQLGDVPQIASIDDPNNPGDKISVLFNPRAPEGQKITRINAPGSGTGGPDPFAGAANPLAPGTTAAAPAPGGVSGGTPSVYGYGRGGFSATPGTTSGVPGTAQTGQGPVEAKTMRESRAKAVIANEEDAVKSARAAAEFKPALDEMTNAYEALVKSGGIGPVQGSEYGRKFQAITGLGAGNEALRQRYDTAKAKVQAQITAAQNKGEGAVSNFERKMYAVQFPELNAVDPATQLPFLRQLQASTHQTINAGRGTSLGSSPGTFERPSIEQPTKAKAPVSVRTPDEARKLPSGTQFVIPDGSGRIGTVP